MKTSSDYDNFKETLIEAKSRGFFDKFSGLVMIGRVGYAYERGDITLA